MTPIYSMYSFDAPIIPYLQARMRGIRRLVQDIIPRDPRVIDIVRGELFPEPDSTVLKVLVRPERGDVCRIIGMPIL